MPFLLPIACPQFAYLDAPHGIGYAATISGARGLVNECALDCGNCGACLQRITPCRPSLKRLSLVVCTAPPRRLPLRSTPHACIRAGAAAAAAEAWWQGAGCGQRHRVGTGLRAGVRDYSSTHMWMCCALLSCCSACELYSTQLPCHCLLINCGASRLRRYLTACFAKLVTRDGAPGKAVSCGLASSRRALALLLHKNCRTTQIGDPPPCSQDAASSICPGRWASSTFRS